MALPSLRAPIPFGRYELLHRIGAGGMGEVFLARLRGPSGADKLCVVKKMLSHLSMERSFVERFVDEAKVVVHLTHGSISQVFEMGEADGEYFMAMEYVEGKTLSRVVARLRERGERFPLPLALYVATRVCDALAYAHRKTDPVGRPLHLVHRDVSPANILISYGGEVKVIDFGAAQSSIKEAHTAPRVVIGNLAYMSPEQARKKPVDARADVYSMAVVLWELVAWTPLPTGGDPAERWKRAAYPRFSSPSKYQPDVPADLDRIVMRALSPDRRDRQASADELRDELQGLLAQIASQTSPSSMAALMRSLFCEEEQADRRLIAEAMAPSARAAACEEVTDPGEPSMPAAPRLLGDGDGDSRTTRPERPRARPQPAEPESPSGPTLVSDFEHTTEPQGAIPGAQRGMAPFPPELTGQTTAPYRQHETSRLFVVLAAFLLGVVLAATAYLGRAALRPDSAPSIAPADAPQDPASKR